MADKDPKDLSGVIRNLPRAHDWDLVSTFMLSVAKEMPRTAECMLKPVADALLPLGLEHALLCNISAAIENAGEELRSNCREGTLDCITTRLNVSTQSMKTGGKPRQWNFFVIKQMVSSESDNLDALEHPTCMIDVHVY